jgi:hypothetical protein
MFIAPTAITQITTMLFMEVNLSFAKKHNGIIVINHKITINQSGVK